MTRNQAAGPRPMTDRQWKVIREMHRRGMIDDDSFANIDASRKVGEFTSEQATLLINPHAAELGMKEIDTSKWRGRDGEAERPARKAASEEVPRERVPDGQLERDCADRLPERRDGEMDNRISVLAKLGKRSAWFTFPMTTDELEARISEAFGTDRNVEDAYGQIAAGDLTYARMDVVALDPRGLAGDIGWSPAQDESLPDINLMTIALRVEDEFLDSAQKRDAIKCSLSCLAQMPGAVGVAAMASNASFLPYNPYEGDAPTLGNTPVDKYAATAFDPSDYPMLSPVGFAGMARAETEQLARDGAVVLGEMGYVRVTPEALAEIARASEVPREALVHSVQGPYESLRESFSSYARSLPPSEADLVARMEAIAADDPAQAPQQLANAAALFEARGAAHGGPAAEIGQLRRCGETQGGTRTSPATDRGARK